MFRYIMQADIVPACICLCKKFHAIDGFVGPVPVLWMQFPIFPGCFRVQEYSLCG